ncbi:hypothetical protein CMV30_15695 [Nibricoccus aquaticus]|uniref:PDZ domain-containing protein n=1 Tax=Nibricoccus aquaticus TaxID=2576891 RepID=A0A290Q995_9BACT|nr:PDZ domain-containing protein [Nibricoccus aquaticus]ATC65275.1 hypothetical protein CMV30_15695 [Nibricoccus aquaticus]
MRALRTLILPTLAIIALSLLPCHLHASDTAPASPEAATAADDIMGDVTLLPALNASAGRIEDFGFRVSPAYEPARSTFFNRVYTPVVDVVLPNTAASRAGLEPGDRIVSSDGAPTASGSFSLKKWRRIQETKWAAVARGENDVTWTLVVESATTQKRRTLHLRIPTPPPRWGDTVWRAPDRRPALIPEPGPLADRARLILDHGIHVLLRRSYLNGLQLPVDANQPYFLCHQWTLWSDSVGHRIYVSQQRGRTDIILEAISAEASADLSANAATATPGRPISSPTTIFARESRVYLTSPSGALERAWALPRGRPQQEIPHDLARPEFQRELDFWLNQTTTSSPRWPLTVNADHTPAPDLSETPPPISEAPISPDQNPPQATSAAFQKLPRATDTQRALFEDAFAKIGAESDRWAYTETTRRAGEKKTTVTRIDPSRPEHERCTLLEIGGKPPTPDELHRWRENGGDDTDPLGELRNLRNSIDRTDLRLFADEVAALVFELPVPSTSADFPSDKFQALFRVNKTTRALEDIVVKLREPLRFSGVVKVTEAGLEARFKTLDPAYPPQPVMLRGGGAVRVLFAKISRDFETTRTHFKRVETASSAP